MTHSSTLQEDIEKTKALVSSSINLRVYYEDTDAGGIVYYANYLRFAERGRTELLRQMGIDHGYLLREHGLLFAVKLVSADYQSPAKLDDLVTVETNVTGVGGASLDMTQIIRHEGGRVLVSAKVRLVAISPEGGVVRIPQNIKQMLLGEGVSEGKSSEIIGSSSLNGTAND